MKWNQEDERGVWLGDGVLEMLTNEGDEDGFF